MPDELLDERPVFLSTLQADRGARRLALATVLVSAALFLAAVPFAKVKLAPLSAFIPIYESALVVCDLVTAVLLFGQFTILRTRALAILASAYLFTATITVCHALTFPSLFAPTGLLGAGPHSTAWLYMFWHGGFPLFVLAYARLDQQATVAPRRSAGTVVVASGACALAVASALTLLATTGQGLLPAVMRGNQYTPTQVVVIATVWALTMVAVLALWRRRTRSVLDVWLMVVLCAWVFDIALSGVLNASRYDLGWYAGRIYGLLAASFVLAVLLLENGVLYARLVALHGREREQHRRVRQQSVELAAANKELEAFSYSVSHDLRAPLRAIDGFSRLLADSQGTQLDADGQRLLGLVRSNARRMGELIEDLLAFARLGRLPLRTEPVQLDQLVQQTITELRAAVDGRQIDFAVGTLGGAEVDPSLLKQVLVNLLGNAVKFTRDRDPAVIEVGCRDAAEADPVRVYYVRDNGAGFDMRHADKLFNVFQRLHRTDEYEGTGVGLAIAQRVIARHGGRIWAEARLGEGATFYFTLQAGENEDNGSPAPRSRDLVVRMAANTQSL